MRSLRFFLSLLALKLILAKPIITSLTGCKRLNSTALDHCKENDIIYINGQNIVFDGIPQIKLSGLDGMDIWSCSYDNDLIQCVVPSFVIKGDWRSVSVRLDDEWSDDVYPGVYVTPWTAPVIRSLQGCNQLNSSALDACTTCGSFHLKVDAIKGDAIPSVQIQSNTGITSFPCFYEDSTHTAIECVLPNNNNLMQDDWWSVAVRTNGDWSNIMSPGIHILDNQNGPNAAQISSACPDTGCVGGEYMTIWGTNLIDNNTDATVFISQDFFNSPTYPSFVCPIDFSFSTATLMYCMLPSIPMSSRGIPLQVTVVNAWGAGTITGPLIYSLPVSSSSSSTGSWFPVPTPPPMPSSSSGSIFIGWLVPSVFVFAIVLSAIVCASRRSARRRAMLLSSNQGITIHQPLYTPPQSINQPINQPLYQPQNQYPGASVPPQQHYYPVVHNYQSANQPSMNYQQPAYQYYPNQPSAPSAYPQVYRQ